MYKVEYEFVLTIPSDTRVAYFKHRWWKDVFEEAMKEAVRRSQPYFNESSILIKTIFNNKGKVVYKRSATLADFEAQQKKGEG